MNLRHFVASAIALTTTTFTTLVLADIAPPPGGGGGGASCSLVTLHPEASVAAVMATIAIGAVFVTRRRRA